MAPIKAIIHEATFTLRAATDGALTVVVIVGSGVAKRSIKKKSGQEQLRLLCYAIVVFHCDGITRASGLFILSLNNARLKGFHLGQTISTFFSFSLSIRCPRLVGSLQGQPASSYNTQIKAVFVVQPLNPSRVKAKIIPHIY